MEALPSVKVRGLPPHLSSAAVQELCSHYGAVRTRSLSGPMRGTTVVEFPTEDAARRGVAALNGLRLWDRTLAAALLPKQPAGAGDAAAAATTSPATITAFSTPAAPSSSPSPSPSPSPSTSSLHVLPMPPQLSPYPPPHHHPFTHPHATAASMSLPPTLVPYHQLGGAIPGAAGASGLIAASASTALGKRPLPEAASEQGPLGSSTLPAGNTEAEPEYVYPPLDVDIVANIVRALSEVPQFYTMTLHLMNRLNLPAPFGPQRKHARSVHQGPQPKRLRTTVAAHDDTDLSTDESELESDAEEEMVQEQMELISSAVHAFQKVPAPALPTSKQYDTIQIKLGSSTATAPADVPVEDAAAISSATDAAEQAVAEPVRASHHEDASARPLTLEELAANRMPVSQLLQAKGYDKYKPGTPSPKLHLKNLHRKKDISPGELLRLFGSFTAPGQSPEDIEIKVMTGRMSGQAFVTLASQELAGQALAAVHGYVLHGLPIFVEYGREGNAKPAAAGAT